MLPDLDGGDDYVTKPFSLEEVVARIRAVLRRARANGPPPPPARMGLLVEDLLLLARLDRQRPLDQGPVDLLALAAEAVNDARAVAPDRRIELVLGTGEGDGDVGAALIVLGDTQRLRQVLANLVSNALTHTPAGSPVEVWVGAAPLDGRPGAAVEVVDHGPGLTPLAPAAAA
jgi:two-component system, OmpR family, sensor kinase